MCAGGAGSGGSCGASVMARFRPPCRCGAVLLLVCKKCAPAARVGAVAAVLRSWRVLDRSWRVLDRSWRVFDRSWRVFRAFSAFGGSRSGRGSICSIATTTGCHSYGTLMILDTGHNETWMAGPRLRFSTNTPNIPVCSISHQLLKGGGG